MAITTLVPMFVLLCFLANIVSAIHGVFRVTYRYAGSERWLIELKAHDSRSQLHLLAGVDLPLGGSGRSDGVGLYYAKIGIGTPSKDHYVQVDPGSDTCGQIAFNAENVPEKVLLVEKKMMD